MAEGFELPSLKPLHGTPALFLLAVINLGLIGSLVYLTTKRSDSFDKAQTEMLRILQHCMDEKVTRSN